VGKAIRTAPGDRVDVKITELDGEDQVELVQAKRAGDAR
jgi:pyrimidine operon attenuation protein/uracil phosphoribosyltransferase